MMDAVPDTEELRRAGFAVIGAGHRGPSLLRHAQHVSDLDVRYLCDVDVDRARHVVGSYSSVPAAGSLQQVLDDPAVHAVAVATPPASHADVVGAALDAGKHVLVEKPLAASLGDGAALVRTAQQRGLTLMLDHTSCYSPAVARLRELLQSGELGDLQHFDAVRFDLSVVHPEVDVLGDLAPHDIAVLDNLHPSGAHPVAVAAHGADPLGLGRSSVGHLSIRLANGGIAHLHVNWLSPIEMRTVIVGGSRRAAVWDDVDPQWRVAVYDRGVDLAGLELDDGPGPGARPARHRIGDMVAPAVGEQDPLRSAIEAFAAAVVHGKPVPTDGPSGLRVLAVLEAARVSMHEGGAFVPLDLSFCLC
jgi:predicted dehydrogenase